MTYFECALTSSDSHVQIEKAAQRSLTKTENHMRKPIVAEHISLDGIIQALGGSKEDPSGDFLRR
jgi:hypothetical protein